MAAEQLQGEEFQRHLGEAGKDMGLTMEFSHLTVREKLQAKDGKLGVIVSGNAELRQINGRLHLLILTL